MNVEEKAVENEMSQKKVRSLDEEALWGFMKSHSLRYEYWKRGDLFLVALQTLPKQAKEENVIDNLLKLMSENKKRLSDEAQT